MQFLKFDSLKNRPFAYISGILICLLMLLYINPLATDDYKGVRIALSDFLLPFIGITILINLCKRKDKLPVFYSQFAYISIFLVSLWVTISLFTPLLSGETLGLWALMNKGVGWFTLIAYFFLGAWFAQNLSDPQRQNLLIIMILGFLLFTGLYGFVYAYDDKPSSFGGSFINRNAWAYCAVICLIICTVIQLNQPKRPLRYPLYLLWVAVPIIMMTYNGSRAGLICVILVFIYFCFIYRRSFLSLMKFPSLYLTVIALGLLYFYPQAYEARNHFDKTLSINSNIQNTQLYLNAGKNLKADQVRYVTLIDSIELWKDSPFIGGGIGSYMPFQIDKRGYFIEIIDSTPLWILAEMGLIGLVLFSLMFGLLAVGLWKRVRSGDKIAESVLLILFIFAVGSLVHQLLYFRPVWLLLGFALAKPAYSEETSGDE